MCGCPCTKRRDILGSILGPLILGISHMFLGPSSWSQGLLQREHFFV